MAAVFGFGTAAPSGAAGTAAAFPIPHSDSPHAAADPGPGRQPGRAAGGHGRAGADGNYVPAAARYGRRHGGAHANGGLYAPTAPISNGYAAAYGNGQSAAAG